MTMRILLVGPGLRGRYGGFYYSTDKKLRNGIIRSGHNCMVFSDRDVADIALGVRALGAGYANGQFLKMVSKFEPDVVILFLAHIITRKTFETARRMRPQMRIANVECDLLDSDKKFARHDKVKGIVDATFLTSAGEPLEELRRRMGRVSFLPNVVDTSIESVRSFAAENHTYDLVYVSSLAAGSPRWKLVEDVERKAPELRVGRYGGKKWVYGTRYFALLESARSALNWSERNDIPLYSSDRIAQLFGSGNCVCLPRTLGYDRFLGENGALYFDGSDDLAANLRDAIRSGRWREIARTGHERYEALFNERRIAQYILAYTLEQNVDAFEWSDI